jgi:type IV pilus assembly protein PilE
MLSVDKPAARCKRPSGADGFTTVELLIALAVLAILSTLAWPGYQQVLLRTRRGDAHAALAQLQQAQERYRGQQPIYASTLGNGGLGLASRSPDGHYTLDTRSDDSQPGAAYRVSASATGAQAADASCRHLAIEVSGGLLQWRSGSSAALDNDADANRRCWNR